MAADRGAFIDQSQSFNVYIGEPTIPKLTSMHYYAWKKGLKTGMYYLRTRPAAQAIQFTVDQTALKQTLLNNLNNQKVIEIPVPQSPIKSMVKSPFTSPIKKSLFSASVIKSPLSPVSYGEACSMKEGCLYCSS